MQILKLGLKRDGENGNTEGIEETGRAGTVIACFAGLGTAYRIAQQCCRYHSAVPLQENQESQAKNDMGIKLELVGESFHERTAD